MSQTSYSLNQDKYFKGMKANSRFDFVASFTAEEASAGVGIFFGAGLTRGTDKENQAKIITNVADVFLGIALYHESQTAGKYENNDSVNVLRQGSAVVESGVAVNAGEKAYVDVATGNFTNVSTGNVDTGGIFTETIASAGLVTVEINLP